MPTVADVQTVYLSMYGTTVMLGDARITAAIGSFWAPLLPCPAYGPTATALRNMATNMAWQQSLEAGK